MLTLREKYLQEVKYLTKAAKEYYHAQTPIMTDKEYDRRVSFLEEVGVENNWTEHETLNKVAAGTTPEKGDVIHETPMLSLAKLTKQEDLTVWLHQQQANKISDLILEPKFDGLAVSVKYVKGKLAQISTRGNGKIGEDVSSYAIDIKGVPEQLPELLTFEIRGEVFITKTDFITANHNRLEHRWKKWLNINIKNATQKQDLFRTYTPERLYQIALTNKYKTPSKKERWGVEGTNTVFRPEDHIFAHSRNAVSGYLRDQSKEYHVPLTFSAYDIVGDPFNVGTYEKTLQQLQQLHISTAQDFFTQTIPVNNFTKIVDTVSAFGATRERKTLDYPTDGIVLKVNSFVHRAMLGEREDTPRWAVAYKYPTQKQETVVREILLTVGRTGRLALTAKLDPVIFDGTRVDKASLHNVSWVQEKDIRIGDTVLIEKALEIIPYVSEVVLLKRPEGTQPWEPPTECPNCGGEWDKTTLLWRCTSPDCTKLSGIIYASGRDFFNWEGLDESLITRLDDEGLVNDLADVFNLTLQQLATLKLGRKNVKNENIMLGEKTATKIFNAIQKSKNTPLPSALAALGVRTLGRSLSRRVTMSFPTLPDIYKANVKDLMTVEGISDKKAQFIYDGLREKLPIVKKMLQYGVKFTPVTHKTNKNIQGLRIVVSGSVPGFTRKQLQDKITQQGAIAVSSVSKNTDLLIADNTVSGNKKYQDAIKYGVKIITPKEFLILLNN